MSQLRFEGPVSFEGPGAYRAPHSDFHKTPQQRFGGILFVAAVHIAIVYALLTTLGVVTLPKTVSDLVVVNVPDLPKDNTVPPPPTPVIETPQVQPTIVPDVILEYVPPQEHAITPPPAEPVPQRQVPPTHVPPIVFTPARAIMATHTTPEYPPVSRRIGEQGTLRLKLTIGTDGHVTNALVVNSSGHDRLDTAAVEWVKAHWLYQPAKRGAEAVASTADAVVVFRLQ
jgi:protein TonB